MEVDMEIAKCDVVIKQMTARDLSVLRQMMAEMDVALLDVRLNLPHNSPEYDLIWPIRLKKKQRYCINGYAYCQKANDAYIIRLREYIPIRWTEAMELQLLRGVEKILRKKGIKKQVWLLVGTLAVRALPIVG